MSQSLDNPHASLLGNASTDQLSPDVLKKLHLAIQKVTREDEKPPTEEEITQLIRNWEPKKDLLCLYVRWARQLKHNFNLDSIATLLCLSRQCGYTPVDFLRKVKTLSISKYKKAAYGMTFHFVTPSQNDINREGLKKGFLGLTVTLALLQEQVAVSPSILGMTRTSNCTPGACPIEVSIGEGQDKHATVLLTHPNVELLNESSLQNRIWNFINHRWFHPSLILDGHTKCLVTIDLP